MTVTWPVTILSSPSHKFSCSTVLPYLLCLLSLFPCSLPPTSSSPSFHFLLLLVPFYRSNCSNQLYKRRLWWFWELDRVEQGTNYSPYIWRHHHRRETGMFKSVHHMFIKTTKQTVQHVAGRHYTPHWSVYDRMLHTTCSKYSRKFWEVQIFL